MRKISKSLAILIALVFIGSGFAIAANEGIPKELNKTFNESGNISIQQPEGYNITNQTEYLNAEIYSGSNWGIGHSVLKTSDGGYIFVGYIEDGDKDLWLMKIDSSGKKEWDGTFGGSKDDEGYSILQIPEDYSSWDEYLIVGYTESYGAGGKDIWLIKITAYNTYISKRWDETFGGSKDDVGYSIQQISDRHIITGTTESYSDEECTWLIGIGVWSCGADKKWDVVLHGLYENCAVNPTKDSEYIIVATTDISEEGYRDVELIKLYYGGGKEWGILMKDASPEVVEELMELVERISK
jgi:hypothetical protein